MNNELDLLNRLDAKLHELKRCAGSIAILASESIKLGQVEPGEVVAHREQFTTFRDELDGLTRKYFHDGPGNDFEMLDDDMEALRQKLQDTDEQKKLRLLDQVIQCLKNGVFEGIETKDSKTRFLKTLRDLEERFSPSPGKPLPDCAQDFVAFYLFLHDKITPSVVDRVHAAFTDLLADLFIAKGRFIPAAHPEKSDEFTLENILAFFEAENPDPASATPTPPAPEPEVEDPSMDSDSPAPLPPRLSPAAEKTIKGLISPTKSSLKQRIEKAGTGLPTDGVNDAMEVSSKDASEEASEEDRDVPETVSRLDSETVADDEIMEETAEAAALPPEAPVPLWPLSLADVPLETITSAELSQEDQETASGEEKKESLNRLVWTLLREKRIGLAYYLTQYMEEVYADRVIPKSMLTAMILAPAIRDQVGQSSFLASLGDKDLKIFTRRDPACAALTFAAVLWPAFIVPHALVPDQFLEELEFGERFGFLNDLRNWLVSQRQEYPLELFRKEFQLHVQIHAMRERIRSWLNRTREASSVYRPAQHVLHDLLRSDREIGSVLEDIITEEDALDRSELESLARKWKSVPSINEMIIETNKKRYSHSQRNPIDGKARKWLTQFITEAGELLDEWIKLHAVPKEDDFERHARETKDDFLGFLAACDENVDTDRVENERDRIALLHLRWVFRFVRRVLEPGAESAVSNFDRVSDMIRDEELLSIDGWDDTIGDPPEREKLEKLECGIRRLLAQGTVGLDENDFLRIDWKNLLEKRWAENNFQATRRVLEFQRLRTQLTNDTEAFQEWERFDKLNEEKFAEIDGKLKEEIEQFKKDIRLALRNGLIGDADRMNIEGVLDGSEEANRERLDLKYRTLAESRDKLRELKAEAIARFKEELDDSGLEKKNPDGHARIMRILDDENLLTAYEYKGLFEKGKHVPRDEQSLPGLDFFPAFFEKTHSYFFGLERKSFEDFAKMIAGKNDCFAEYFSEHPSFDQIDGDKSQKAEKALRLWDAMKSKPETISTETLHELFTFLGFKDVKVKKENGFFTLECRVLNDRDDCILPDFGSHCRGVYHVRLFTDLVDVAKIVDLAVANSMHRTGQVAIILCLRPVAVQQRQAIAEFLRTKYHDSRLLLLDDVLMLYLALQDARPLSFFNAAGMFSSAQPYSQTPGVLAQEMFFGREEELRNVSDFEGTSLIYGGRQMGKTVLVRHIQKMYHKPEAGFIVHYVDLKGDNLATSPERIWGVLSQEFSRYGIVDGQIFKGDKFLLRVKEWLKADSNRRILLFLDEADDFLTADGSSSSNPDERPWRQLSVFTKLMHESVRHFKVVFVGLHYVQRTATDPNTPIAHLQSGVRIGPFDYREYHDAVSMIRLPFKAMGYHIDDDDIMHILATVNYYPSLIQVLCKELLLHMFKKRRSPDSPNSPLGVVTRQDIDEVVSDERFLNDIRSRFRWTLDLDPRYAVLAMMIAELNLKVGVRELSLKEIIEWAKSYWPLGFSENYREMETLLIEMIDLGILRETRIEADGKKYFFLRSPHVFNLLGDEAAIQQELEDARGSFRPDLRDIHFYRSKYKKSSDKFWRHSSLARAQEQAVLGGNQNDVFLFHGTEASGIDEIVPFFKSLFKERTQPGAIVPINVKDLDEYRAWWKKNAAARENELTFLFFTPEMPWKASWIKESRDRLNAFTARERRIKVIFLADADKAWTEKLMLPDTVEKYLKKVRRETLPPWDVRSIHIWMQDLQFGRHDQTTLDLIRGATGYWNRFLGELGKTCGDDPTRWRIRIEEYQNDILKNPERRQAVLDRFGILPKDEDDLSRKRWLALRAFAHWVDMSPKDLTDVEKLPADFVNDFIPWAGKFHFIAESPKDPDTLRVDPFLGQLLCY